MKLWQILTVIVPVLAYSASNNLIQVNDANFKEVVLDSGKFTFVDFYADWCRHCKKLMPTIEELAELFSDYEQVQVVKINGDTDGKRMGKKHVTIGYPTMKLFHGSDEPIEFDGLRDIESISNFVQQITGIRLEKQPEAPVEHPEEPTSEPTDESKIVLLGDDNFNEKVLENNTPSVVAFGATWCSYCQEVAPVIDVLASEIYQNDNLQIGKIEIDTKPGDVICEQYGVENLPTIMLFNTKDSKGPITFRGSKSIAKLVKAINAAYGLSRDVNGGLLPNAGTIENIDEYFSEKLNSGEELSSIALEALPLLSPENENSLYYKRIFNLIINGNFDLLKQELSRILSILSNDFDKLPAVTIDSMEKRRNILRKFIGNLN